MRRISLIGLAVLVFAALVGGLTPPSALASAPTVTLGEPANGALITGGQPTFSGAAGNSPAYSGVVMIDVYAGTTSTGELPAQVLDTTVANGSFSAQTVGLIDGTYTAVATESDAAGNTGSSEAVTFDVFNATPGLALTAPPAPIQTYAPTFTGTAETGPGDGSSAQLIIYPGTSTNATPLAVLTGSIAANGTFSIQVLPGLTNGTYTAVAGQSLAIASTFSPAVQFTVAGTPPALTLTSPSATNPTEPQTDVVFAGAAGDEYGDSDSVDLTLYRGTSASGTPLGTATATRNGAVWGETWSPQLALGTYTLVASQENIVNQTTTVTRTFTVAAPGSVTGAVTISAAGTVSARLACLAGAGRCTGDVLIVTKTALSPSYGGPRGPLHLMFVHYSVAAAQSVRLTAQLSRAQLAALRRAGPTALVVTVAYPLGAKLAESSRTTAKVKVG
jgi:hypothetical protein